MKLTRAAFLASVTTSVLWTLKAIVIAVLGSGSVLESVLFMTGFLACIVATVLVGAALFAHRSVAWRVLGAVIAFVGVTVVGTLIQVVVAAFEPQRPAWWWEELNLWAIMLALLGVAVLERRRVNEAVAAEPVPVG